MKGRFLLLAVLLAGLFAVGSQADDHPPETKEPNELRIVAGYSDIVFNTLTGMPKRWALCQSLCNSDDPRRALLLDSNDGFFQIGAAWGSGGALESSVTETDTHVIVRFAAPDAFYEYALAQNEALIDVTLPEDTQISIGTGSTFVPDELPGFGVIYSRVSLVQVDASGQQTYEYAEESGSPIKLVATEDNWTGLRNRYWTMLMQPVGQSAVFGGGYSEENRPYLDLRADQDSNYLNLRMYAGPTDWEQLRKVDPVLTGMMFAALFDMLRWLCFGMLVLLEFIYSFVGNYGIAIILLSLTVKILMLPLTKLAEKWQQDVNRIQTLLAPELAEIRKKYSGEVAHQFTLELYKKHNVSTFYTFKSAAGFLIQIPIFIAAFDVLAENVSLNQISFLWIADLGRPDAFLQLPFVLPFFGGWLNLLPFLMSALSILAAWLQQDESLSPALQRQQSIRLYLMAAAFWVLFYTFPAGMVLYWTSSNLFHLIKVESGRLFKRG